MKIIMIKSCKNIKNKKQQQQQEKIDYVDKIFTTLKKENIALYRKHLQNINACKRRIAKFNIKEFEEIKTEYEKDATPNNFNNGYSLECLRELKVSDPIEHQKRLASIGEYYRKLKISDPQKYKESQIRYREKLRIYRLNNPDECLKETEKKNLTDNKMKNLSDNLEKIAKEISAKEEKKRIFKLNNPEKVKNKLQSWKDSQRIWRENNPHSCKLTYRKKLILVDRMHKDAQLTLF